MLKNHPKTVSRRAALQLLYSAEITDQTVADLLAQGALVFENEEAEAAHPDAYAVRLLEGIGEHKEEIDQMVDSASDNWAIGRMPIMDRSILRIAVYEMMFIDDLPLSVSIDEAVELAKKYGGEDESHRFVNGVLGQVAKRLDAPTEYVDQAFAGLEESIANANQTAEQRDEPAEHIDQMAASLEESVAACEQSTVSVDQPAVNSNQPVAGAEE